MITQKVTLEVRDILPASKAAKYLGITRMTLWRWVQAGKIAAIKLDRTYFHINELDRVKALRKKHAKSG